MDKNSLPAMTDPPSARQQVRIRRAPENGDVILSAIPNIEAVYAALDAADLPADFLSDRDRDRRPPEPGKI